jgi:outer membrane protein assembly factor BamA
VRLLKRPADNRRFGLWPWLLPLTVSLFSACGIIHLGELTPPDGRQHIVDVRILGTDKLSAGAIADVLANYSDNLKITGQKPLLSRTKLASDARRIESYAQAHGFFEARVTDYWAEDVSPTRVRVFFRMVEGRSVHTAEVSFGEPLEYALTDFGQEDDEEALTRIREVASSLTGFAPLREGQVYRSVDYEEGLRRIRDELVLRGFLFAEVLGDVFVVLSERKAYVRYHIAPGPLVRLSEVVVDGNRRIPAARILRRVDMRPGDPVTRSALRSSEANIYALRVFFGVAADPGRPSRDDLLGDRPLTIENLRALPWPTVVPVVIRVQEMPIHEISLGVGTSIESTQGELYGLVGYINRNFIGGLRYFDVTGRPALVSLPSFFEPDPELALGASVDLSFRQPSVLEEYIEFGLRLGYGLEVEEGYRAHRVGLSPVLSRRFWNVLTLSFGMNLLYYRYFDYRGALNLDLTDTLGLEFREAYLLNEFEQMIELDLRDVIYDPRRGGYLAFRMSQSLGRIGSDFDYVRFSLDGRIYYTPWSFVTLALQFRYGQTVPLFGGDVPLPARFRGGGPSDMRGYGAGRMGPYICQTTDSQTGERVVTTGSGDLCRGRAVFTGGNLHLGMSAELRFYLPANFGLVAFADAGEVWALDDDFAFRALNVAVGPGLRYFTPFGPIRFDFGVQVTPPRPGRFTWHISIGQAF